MNKLYGHGQYILIYLQWNRVYSTFMYVCVFIGVSVHVHECLCKHVSVCARGCVFVEVCVHLWLDLIKDIHMNTYSWTEDTNETQGQSPIWKIAQTIANYMLANIGVCWDFDNIMCTEYDNSSL